MKKSQQVATAVKGGWPFIESEDESNRLPLAISRFRLGNLSAYLSLAVSNPLPDSWTPLTRRGVFILADYFPSVKGSLVRERIPVIPFRRRMFLSA